MLVISISVSALHNFLKPGINLVDRRCTFSIIYRCFLNMGSTLTGPIANGGRTSALNNRQWLEVRIPTPSLGG